MEQRKVVTPRRRSVAWTTLVTILAGAIGCQMSMLTSGGSESSAGDPTNDTVSFTAQIQPIFTVQCAGCHSPGGIADLAGIALKLTEGVAYDLLINQNSVQDASLLLVVPGDSASSLLLAKVSSDTPPIGQRMPLFSPVLSMNEINLIEVWIDQGALDN